MYPQPLSEITEWRRTEFRVTDNSIARSSYSRPQERHFVDDIRPATEKPGDPAERNRQEALEFLHKLVMG